MAEQVSSLKTGIKYKDTPIGKIPVDWEVISLRDVSEINMGQSPPSEDCNEKEEGLPFYQGNAEFGSKYPSPKKWCEKPKKIADEGDILISVRAPVGEINIAPHKCCIGRGLAAITAKSIHSQFLYHLLFLRRKYLQKISQGSTFEAINSKELSDLLIFLPAVTEQKKIAEILTTLDEAIEKTSQIIEKTKEAKKGLMQRLFTRGIGHKKFKKTEIGDTPVEWEVRRLGDLCNGQPEYGANVSSIDKDKSLPRYIRITDITEDGKLLEATWQSIKREFAQPYILEEGDFLFARSGATVGKTYLYRNKDGECAFAGYMIRFKPNPKQLLPELLFQYTHSNFYYNWVKGILRAGAQPNINAQEYFNMPLPKPPINEQKQIAEILSSVDEELEKESNHKEHLELLKKGLMQVLLTGKIRVSV
jgi:type I restriction enzyme S subunit